MGAKRYLEKVAGHYLEKLLSKGQIMPEYNNDSSIKAVKEAPGSREVLLISSSLSTRGNSCNKIPNYLQQRTNQLVKTFTNSCPFVVQLKTGGDDIQGCGMGMESKRKWSLWGLSQRKTVLQ